MRREAGAKAANSWQECVDGSFSLRSLTMKVVFLWCGVQTRCWWLCRPWPERQAKPAHVPFWRFPLPQAPRRPGPATASDAMPSWTHSPPRHNSNQTSPWRQKLRPENQHTKASVHCWYGPVFPCTVSGGGACRVGVSDAVAISAQAALPHSAHKHRHSRYICMPTGLTSSRVYTFPC